MPEPEYLTAKSKLRHGGVLKTPRRTTIYRPPRDGHYRGRWDEMSTSCPKVLPRFLDA